MSHLLQDLPVDATAPAMGWLDLLLRLGLAGVLGAWTAGLYLWVRTPDRRHAGLGPTLVPLAMLITMVTIAVGGNIAVAFALVGTLAIVRFRTNIQDVRDTTFVIFAVAIGIAAGQSIMIACLGTLMISLALVILVRTGMLARDPETGGGRVALTLVLSPPAADLGPLRAVLASHGIEAELRKSEVERVGRRMKVEFHCEVAEVESMTGVSQHLLEDPDVVQASFTRL